MRGLAVLMVPIIAAKVVGPRNIAESVLQKSFASQPKLKDKALLSQQRETLASRLQGLQPLEVDGSANIGSLRSNFVGANAVNVQSEHSSMGGNGNIGQELYVEDSHVESDQVVANEVYAREHVEDVSTRQESQNAYDGGSAREVLDGKYSYLQVINDSGIRQMTLFESEVYGWSASHFFRDFYEGMTELVEMKEGERGFDVVGLASITQPACQLKLPRSELLISLNETWERNSETYENFSDN